MHGLAGAFVLTGGVSWQIVPGPHAYRNIDGVFVNFTFFGRVPRRRALEIVAERLKENEITWLRCVAREWHLNLEQLRQSVDPWKNVDWMTGIVPVEPEVETERLEIFDKEREETYVQFIVTREEIELAATKRVFLSHKGVDKPLVRRIYAALGLLGFEPWLDEADMNAGAELERALLRGMKESCAAVFFITPDYVDDNYLATEVDYAIAEKRAKTDDFSIITLVLQKKRAKGTVPELLQKYVWKEPETELDILSEILKALPICVGKVRWRKENAM